MEFFLFNKTQINILNNMINLQQGVSKDCVFTLNEKVTITDPYFILELTNTENNNNIILFNSLDIGLTGSYYNTFEILCGTGSGVTGSVTFDTEPGMYDYVVYQSATSSLIITDCILEKGLVNIQPEDYTEMVSYIPDGASQSITVTASNIYGDDDSEFIYYE